MLVKAGSTDVTTYFHLRLAADGTDAVGLTITNIDLTYVRTLEEPAAKVDATALADQDSAHGDNQAIEVDGTNMPGVYRVDWPDAAFAAGAREVILTVKVATAFTESLRVQLTQVPADVTHWLGTAAATPTVAGVPEVDVTHWIGTAAATPTVAGVPEVDATHFGGSALTQSGGRPEVNTTHAAGTAWNSGAFTANTAASGAFDAVWSVASRILTAGTNIQLPSNGLANVTAWTVALTGNITGNLSGSVGSVTGAVGSVTGNVGGIAGTITTLDALDTAQDSQHSTTQGLVTTVDGVVDAIKAKTDSLTFTQAGHVDANIQRVNDVLVAGTGAEGDRWGA